MPDNSGDRAWLVTWENATQDDRSVELVLPGELPVERVKWLVQELYLAKTASDARETRFRSLSTRGLSCGNIENETRQ